VIRARRVDNRGVKRAISIVASIWLVDAGLMLPDQARAASVTWQFAAEVQGSTGAPSGPLDSYLFPGQILFGSASQLTQSRILVPVL
jgi:hypothetical protein